MGVLETPGDFGNLWRFWKPTEGLETYGGLETLGTFGKSKFKLLKFGYF
jgi:hypothetical protein